MSKWIEDLNIGTKTTKPTETACRTKGEETEKEKLEQQRKWNYQLYWNHGKMGRKKNEKDGERVWL